MIQAQGILYLVGTPIGNLEDITLRAIRVLKEVNLIAAEDTRTARILLGRYEIKKPLISYYDPREETKSRGIVEKLKRGEKIALISESGMPGISDPGFRLVRAAIAAGIAVVPVPGPSSVLAALVVSGLPTDRFAFEGFLPPRPAAALSRLAALREEGRTLIFFESPRRLFRTLEHLERALGDRRIAVARELTKKFEEVIRGTIPEVRSRMAAGPRRVRGEIVIVVEGKTGPSAASELPLPEQVKKMETELGISRMEAIKLVAKTRGVGKSEVYRAIHPKTVTEKEVNSNQ
ncbi:MAG: 16S rRNA (cytidine(1402)-2'-O)-methyltransferase [Candidatus Aureabacteria bacterium]|nr:16S rRNA (cytidine(1402)-2'-O)-methyltransferase [Candidatus Auribacterota bacterium]